MTKYKNHNRRSIRLPGYDYTKPGAYFITIITHNRQCLFGDIVNGEMVLNEWVTLCALNGSNPNSYEMKLHYMIMNLS